MNRNSMKKKTENYEHLLIQIEALLEGEHDMIANMANIVALLYHTLSNISWAGFYLYKNSELILGPFQGDIACMHIAIGSGVCGTSALHRQSLNVEDVHCFEGHIACDSTSKSELVVPLLKENTLLGVLDLDSALLARFDSIDETYMNKIVHILCDSFAL